MKRDFALRIDSLLNGVRGSLDSISSYMKNNIRYGNISEDEGKRYILVIGQTMAKTIEISEDLYRAFPDTLPDELKSRPSRKRTRERSPRS